MAKIDKQKLADAYFKSSDEKACIVTDDGQIFAMANESYARAHCAKKQVEMSVMKPKAPAKSEPAKKAKKSD